MSQLEVLSGLWLHPTVFLPDTIVQCTQEGTCTPFQLLIGATYFQDTWYIHNHYANRGQRNNQKVYFFIFIVFLYVLVPNVAVLVCGWHLKHFFNWNGDGRYLVRFFYENKNKKERTGFILRNKKCVLTHTLTFYKFTSEMFHMACSTDT